MLNKNERGGPSDRPSTSPLEKGEHELSGWDFAAGDEISDGLSAIKLLGGGTRYEAYLAVSDVLLSTVVVKILRPDCVASSSALRGLAAEQGALRSLEHPSVPRCFGGVLDGERPHLVLEFIEGPRLSTLIRKYKALPLEQLIPLGVELAAALHYLHGRDMVHLDVKPQNIIMSAPPKLIDMSVARSTSDALSLDVPVGTDAYMAPEQCRAVPGTVGTPADIWGLGATLWHAATGERPFPKSEERFPQLNSPAPNGHGRLPQPIAEWIGRCMSSELSQRPSAREVADELEPFLAALPRKPVIGMFRPKSGRNVRRW